MSKIYLTEAQQIERGKFLALILNLKPLTTGPDKNRYMLGEGYHTKTALGLFRVIESIVLGGVPLSLKRKDSPMSNDRPRPNTYAPRYLGRQILGAIVGLLVGYIWYLIIKASIYHSINALLSLQ